MKRGGSLAIGTARIRACGEQVGNAGLPTEHAARHERRATIDTGDIHFDIFLIEELFELGDKEEDAGLHARDGHHRSGYDRASHDVPTSQLSMLILLVKPLFDAIHRLAPMTKQLEHVHELIEHWRKEASFSVS